MLTNEIVTPLIGIAIVIFAIVRQVTPQRVGRLQFIILPVIAAYEAYHSLPRPTLPLGQATEFLLMACVSVAAGFIQAFSARVYSVGQEVYVRGGWVSVVAWAALILVRVAIRFAFQGVGLSRQTEWMLWAAIAVTFGVRSFVLYARHAEVRMALQSGRADRRLRRNHS